MIGHLFRTFSKCAFKSSKEQHGINDQSAHCYRGRLGFYPFFIKNHVVQTTGGGGDFVSLNRHYENEGTLIWTNRLQKV
jgi:hypothetical protein